jgi:translation initiation factor 4E
MTDKESVSNNVEKPKAENNENGGELPSDIPANSKLILQLPMKQKWCLWFLNNKKDADWTDRLSEVYKFSKIEEFIALYDNIRPPSTCIGCDYNLFKENIQPMWEVKENKEGGRLLVFIERNRSDVLDILWSELLFALVGNQFGDDTPSICGAVCNIRTKGFKISLWTTNCNDDEANKRIGEVMKKIFTEAHYDNFKPQQLQAIRYEEHENVKVKSGSKVQERFVIIM